MLASCLVGLSASTFVSQSMLFSGWMLGVIRH